MTNLLDKMWELEAERRDPELIYYPPDHPRHDRCRIDQKAERFDPIHVSAEDAEQSIATGVLERVAERRTGAVVYRLNVGAYERRAKAITALDELENL